MSRVLVLSGGGSKGAFQVGAVNYLVRNLNYTFDVVAGVSVGSLNASMIAQGKLVELNNFWNSITNDKVYIQYDTPLAWLFRKLLGDNVVDLFAAIRRGYMYDSSPLRVMLTTNVMPNQFKSLFRCGAVELNTGKYIVGTEKDSNIVYKILASASMPIYFPPVSLDGVIKATVSDPGLYVDGGIRHITPLKDAFDALKTLPVGTEIDEVWIILAGPLGIQTTSVASNSVLKLLGRTVDLITDEIFIQDIKNCILINQNPVNGQRKVKLNVIMPNKVYSEDLQFDPKIVEQAMKDGFIAAQTPLDEIAVQNIINTID